MNPNETDVDIQKDREINEGAYTFLPEWRSPWPIQYSTINKDVGFQKGKFINQWTISFKNTITNEQAIIKVRYAAS